MLDYNFLLLCLSVFIVIVRGVNFRRSKRKEEKKGFGKYFVMLIKFGSFIIEILEWEVLLSIDLLVDCWGCCGVGLCIYVRVFRWGGLEFFWLEVDY